MSILHDWQHEGPDDPAADEALLEKALELADEFRNASDQLMGLEEFKQELGREEAAGELPG